MDHRRFLDRHPLAVYTGITYAISWTFWGLWAAVPDAGDLPSTALYVAGGFGPVLAALLLIRASGRPVRPWLRRTFRVRARPRYYLIALTLPVAAVALAGAAHAGVLGGTVTPEAVESPLAYPIFLGVVLLFFGGQEEPGWRGYLLPRLQESHSALRSALAIGVVWAFWHLPLFVLPGTIQNDIVFPLYVVNLLALSVVLTWVTNGANGSVLPAMLLHAGSNAVVNYYPVGGPDGAVSVTGYGLLTAVVVLVAIALVRGYGPGELAPVDEQPATPAGGNGSPGSAGRP